MKKDNIYNIKNTISSTEIKAFRGKLGLTQSEFAKLLGVSKPTIERMEHSDKEISGAIAVLIDLLSDDMSLVENRLIPKQTFPLRLWYMFHDKKCTLIDVDELNRKVYIKNYVSNILYCAFGANQHPSYEDYEEFLKSRCFPETRDKIKLDLDALNIPFYDPMMIIEKTQGKMEDDDFKVIIERA